MRGNVPKKVGVVAACGTLVAGLALTAGAFSIFPFAPSVAHAASAADTYSDFNNAVTYASISASNCDSVTGTTTCNITAGEAVTINWMVQGSYSYVYASWAGGYVANGGTVTKMPGVGTTTYYIYAAADTSACSTGGFGGLQTCKDVTVQINVHVSPAQTYPPTPASQMHVSYGRVNASGVVLSGSGDFKVAPSEDLSANGYVPVFKITFNADDFSYTPVILVDADYIGTCGSYSNMAFRARMNYVSYDAATDQYTAELVTGARQCYVNVPFSFIAIGPSNSPNANSVGVAFGEFNADGTVNTTVTNSNNWTSYLALAGSTYGVNFNRGVFTGTPTVIANDRGYVDCTALMSVSSVAAAFTERHDNCVNVNTSQPSTFIAVGPTSNAAYSMSNWNVVAATVGGSGNVIATTGGVTGSYNTSAHAATAYFPSGWFNEVPTVVASPHPGPFTGNNANWDRVNFCAAASSMSAANTTINFTGDGNQNAGSADLCTYSNHTPTIGTDLIAIGPYTSSGGTITVTSEDSAVTSTLIKSSWYFPVYPSKDPCSVAPCSGATSTYPNMPLGSYTLAASSTSAGPMMYVLHSVELQPVARRPANSFLSLISDFLHKAEASVVCGFMNTNPSTCPNPTPTLDLAVNGDTANFIILWDPVAAIDVNPSAVSLNAAAGSSTSTQVTLINSGATGSTLNWTASSSAPWLTVWPDSGCLNAGGKVVKGCPDTNGYEYLTLTANTRGLAVGTYTGTVTFNGTSTPTTTAKAPAQQTVAVTLTVGAASPPPPPSNPPSCTFGASPQQIVPPAPSALSWSCTNAASCTLSGGEFGSGQGESTSGSASVSPTTDTTYTLSCEGFGSGPTNTVTTQTTVVTQVPSMREINP